MMPVMDRSSSLHDINELLTRIADAPGFEFTLNQNRVVPELSQAVERLLQSDGVTSQEDVTGAFRFLNHPVVTARLYGTAAEVCGEAGAVRFLRELEAALIGEQIVSAVRDKSTAALQALIPRMIGTLRGDANPQWDEDTEIPQHRSDGPFEIADRFFVALAEHPRYSSDSFALQQARGWIYRRLAALEPTKARSFGVPFALKVPIVRGSSAGGEVGWLHVARFRDGQGGCAPEPQMLCYLRDEAFERAIRTAWTAAQAFVQNEANRRHFFASLSAREIRKRLETEQVRWRIEIGGQRDHLRGDSVGAATAVAFVSVLTNLHYDCRVLLTATTDDAGQFGKVGHIDAKVRTAMEQPIGKILVSPTPSGFENPELLQTIGTIAEALEWTNRPSDTVERLAANSTEHEQENRLGMLRNIKAICRKRNQLASLKEDHLSLNFQSHPNLVVSPTNLILRRAGLSETDILPGTVLNDFCRDEQNAILLLGSKGAGKSTLLWELAEDLVASALNDPALPIPIVFDLISWSGGQNLDKWLVEELIRPDGYAMGTKIGKRLAWNWVKNGKLLLLLDGLDEVEESRRAACVRAINAYRDAHKGVFCPLVVCCRTQDYEPLPRLHLNNTVIVQPLTRQQIDDYISTKGDSLADLKDALADDPTLYEFYSAPLMLSLAVKVYSQPDGNALPNSLSKEERERRLWDTYIALMIDQHKAENRSSYAREDVFRWLEWLGYYLTRNNRNRYLIEEMQPAELLPRFQAFLVRWLFGMMMYAIAVGLLFVILFGRTTLAMAMALPLLFMAQSRTVTIDHVSVYNPARLRRDWKRIPVGGIFGLLGGGCIGGLAIEMGGWANHAANGLMLGIESGAMIGIYLGLFFAVMLTLFEDKIFVPNRPASGIPYTIRTIATGPLQGGVGARLCLLTIFVFLGIVGVSVTVKIVKNSGPGAADVICVTMFLVSIIMLIVSIGIQQGIRMAFAWIIIMVTLALSLSLASTKNHSSDYLVMWMVVIVVFLLFTVVAGMRGGARTVFQHYLLRWFLARSGQFPYHIKPFLDWADQRILVVRKGGGWEFFHIALKQHFAKRFEKSDNPPTEFIR